MIESKVYKKAYIYLITVVDKESSLFGKKYVGKSNGNRKSYITGSVLIGRLIKKRGHGSINKEVIVKLPMTDAQMNYLEIFYIDYYNTFTNGLNLTLGGDGNSGYKVSALTKERQSNAKLGVKRSKDARKQLSISHTGLKHSDETREKIKKAKIGNKNPMYDETLYSFVHKSGIEEEGITQCDMRNKYNLSPANLNSVIKGRQNSIKGWKINIKTNTDANK